MLHALSFTFYFIHHLYHQVRSHLRGCINLFRVPGALSLELSAHLHYTCQFSNFLKAKQSSHVKLKEASSCVILVLKEQKWAVFKHIIKEHNGLT